MTVAKVDRSNFKKEQSVYMPVIPAIAQCPEHLLPSKEWENAFLADFSKLRQVIYIYLINNQKKKKEHLNAYILNFLYPMLLSTGIFIY